MRLACTRTCSRPGGRRCSASVSASVDCGGVRSRAAGMRRCMRLGLRSRGDSPSLVGMMRASCEWRRVGGLPRRGSIALRHSSLAWRRRGVSWLGLDTMRGLLESVVFERVLRPCNPAHVARTQAGGDTRRKAERAHFAQTCVGAHGAIEDRPRACPSRTQNGSSALCRDRAEKRP